jgi:hypothetical protein
VTLSLVTMESSLDRRSKSRKPRAERKRSRGRVSSTEPELLGAEGLTACFLPTVRAARAPLVRELGGSRAVPRRRLLAQLRAPADAAGVTDDVGDCRVQLECSLRKSPVFEAAAEFHAVAVRFQLLDGERAVWLHRPGA